MSPNLLCTAILSFCLSAVQSRTPQFSGNWNIIRRATDADRVDLLFIFKRNATQLRALESAFWSVSDPEHPKYGQHLTQTQVTDIVSPSDYAIAIVHGWVNRTLSQLDCDYHMQSGVHRDILLVDVSGACASQLLKTDFWLLTHNKHSIVRAIGSGYQLPAFVTEHIHYVGNVQDIPAVHTSLTSSPASDSSLLTHATTSNWPTDCGKCSTGFDLLPPMITPKVLAERYNLGSAPNSSSTIKGSAAVAEFTQVYYDQDDLDKFAEECSLPSINITLVGENRPSRCMVPIIIGPNICKEALLDIQTIKGVIGAVPLTDFYNKEYSILSWAKQLEDLPDGKLPLVHSVSYGNDESQQTGDAYMQAVNVEMQKLGVRGITILFASGDGGVFGREGSRRRFHAGFPASSPFVTAVGGTDFVEKSVIGDEKAWSGSGGGFSDHFAIPDYQQQAVATYKDTAQNRSDFPEPSQYNNTGRGFPDVAALGGAQNQYCIAAQKNLYYAYGTSAATPVVAGVFVKLNELRLARGDPPLGFVNPLLYKHPEAFNDVTQGNNGNSHTASTTGGFPAVVGWDAATGLGTPDYEKLKSII